MPAAIQRSTICPSRQRSGQSPPASMPASVAGTLARADARSGDPVAIAEYLGEDDQFDRSITNFAKRHADQNERDYQASAAAIRSGRLQALEDT
jgi:Uncharacterized protein conserved in bacteria (DUF2252)